MTSGSTPPPAEIEKITDDLTDGLKTCRSVLNDYRAILSSSSGSAGPREAQGSNGETSLIDAWRTQEDSNL